MVYVKPYLGCLVYLLIVLVYTIYYGNIRKFFVNDIRMFLITSVVNYCPCHKSSSLYPSHAIYIYIYMYVYIYVCVYVRVVSQLTLGSGGCYV